MLSLHIRLSDQKMPKCRQTVKISSSFYSVLCMRLKFRVVPILFVLFPLEAD